MSKKASRTFQVTNDDIYSFFEQLLEAETAKNNGTEHGLNASPRPEVREMMQKSVRNEIEKQRERIESKYKSLDWDDINSKDEENEIQDKVVHEILGSLMHQASLLHGIISDVVYNLDLITKVITDIAVFTDDVEYVEQVIISLYARNKVNEALISDNKDKLPEIHKHILQIILKRMVMRGDNVDHLLDDDDDNNDADKPHNHKDV